VRWPAFSLWATLALGLIAAAPAAATTPVGENGLVVFEDGGGVAGGDLWKVNADGSQPVSLTNNSPPTYQNYPAFSAHGARIFFVRKPATDPEGIWSMAFDGSDEVQILTFPAADQLYGLEVSPDGQWLAYSRYSANNVEIWRAGVDGSGATNLTNTPLGNTDEYVTGWSPDGQWIAFQRCTGPVDPCDDYMMRADGSDLRNLTNSPTLHETGPSFSPDGVRFTFERFDDSADIWTMNLDGSGALNLTDAPGKTAVDGAPVFSADGKQIYFDRCSAFCDLWVVPAGGGTAVNLTPNFAPDASEADAQSIQRCGKRQATLVGDDGANTITGTNGPDVIVANASTDKVNGLGGKDLICGSAGKDKLKGGKGKDKLIGGPGKDTLIGGGGGDSCNGSKGRDKAKGCEKEKGIP
jgi:Tol biopolymer transport system component